MPLVVELLLSTHDRTRFDCGNADLNAYLRRFAGQQQRKGIGKTYVALTAAGGEAAGFVTVSVGQVAPNVMSANLGLPRHPVPMLRIGRLAVDRRAQGRGIESTLVDPLCLFIPITKLALAKGGPG